MSSVFCYSLYRRIRQNTTTIWLSECRLGISIGLLCRCIAALFLLITLFISVTRCKETAVMAFSSATGSEWSQSLGYCRNPAARFAAGFLESAVIRLPLLFSFICRPDDNIRSRTQESKSERESSEYPSVISSFLVLDVMSILRILSNKTPFSFPFPLSESYTKYRRRIWYIYQLTV